MYLGILTSFFLQNCLQWLSWLSPRVAVAPELVTGQDAQAAIFSFSNRYGGVQDNHMTVCLGPVGECLCGLGVSFWQIACGPTLGEY
jgi:hypothetical protein